MQPLSRIAGAVMAVAGVAVLSAVPAVAKCTTLAFSVNDYGKDGPTADAKSLLDKYIAKWAADNKIAKYNVGKKDVSCELFLNFIVFDEHTCKAKATVCFNEPPGGVKLPQDMVAAEKPAAPKKEKADGAAKAVQSARPAPVATRKAVTETGAVPAAKIEPAKAPATTTAPAPAPAAAPVAPAPDKAAEAAAAAEKAAAAAERAAAAAERAAAAAAKTPAAVAPAAPAAAAPKIAQ